MLIKMEKQSFSLVCSYNQVTLHRGLTLVIGRCGRLKVGAVVCNGYF